MLRASPLGARVLASLTPIPVRHSTLSFKIFSIDDFFSQLAQLLQRISQYPGNLPEYRSSILLILQFVHVLLPISSSLMDAIVESNCPNSYAYAFDEPSGTALWTCNSSLQADYTVTFCPP